jgi:hypothetical protein
VKPPPQERNMNRQNSRYSNQSVFIFENSEEYDLQRVNTQKKKPSVLSKKMTKIVIEDIKKNEPINKNNLFKKSFFFLRFYEKEAMMTYEIYENIRTANSLKKNVILNSVYISIMAIGLYNIGHNDTLNNNNNYEFIIVKAILLLLLTIITNRVLKLKAKMNHLRMLIMSIYLAFTITIQVHMNFVPNYMLINLIMEQNLTLIIVSYSGVLLYIQTVLNLGVHILIFIINIAVNSTNPLFVKYLVFEITICLIIFIFLVIRQYIGTLEYLKNKCESENLKTIEELLFNLMPQHVVQNLKEDIPVADVLYNVTILFSDIVKFTDYSSTKEPFEVVNMLSELFNEFDDSSKKHNVYKVHTIGDCYVVIGFTGKVPMNERNYKEEANNVVKMGESMIETIQRVREKVEFLELDMRIGIHTVKIFFN